MITSAKDHLGLFYSLIHSVPPTRRQRGASDPSPASRNPGVVTLRGGISERGSQRAEDRGAGLARGRGHRVGSPARRMLTSGCLRRMCLLMEALVDTLVPHSWQLCASTLSWVSCTCFCSMYSVTYFLSHTEHVHCLPTERAHGEGETSVGGEGVSL